ncbi:hypothetical protein B0H14DRAFT_2626473 [Mycena olivaceomarginata]|nr:hypothetical protein B0H14DRAFT_2626473 [Mycena olivaceomarginata]
MLLGCSIEWEGKVMASRIQVLTPYHRIQAYLVNVGDLILSNNLGIASVIAARSEKQVGGSRKGTETSEADRCMERIQRLVGDGKAYDVCASTDRPYLAAASFPNADWERLRLASQIITFVPAMSKISRLTWALAIDNPHLTDMFHDVGASKNFRQETRNQFNRYLADTLALEEATCAQISPTLQSFVPVGEVFAFRMTKGQRKQMLDELNKYLDACRHQLWTSTSDSRMGTSCVGFIIACVEYIFDIDLGDTIGNDKYVKVVFDETVLNISYQDLQMAVDEIYRIILCSTEKLEDAAKLAL